MTPNRKILILGSVVTLLLLSGCVGFITGDEPLRAESEPSSVDDTSLAQADFEFKERTKQTYENSLSGERVGIDEKRTVIYTAHKSEYVHKRDVLGEEQEVAYFVTYTSPSAYGTNPLGHLSNKQIIDLTTRTSDMGAVQDIENVGEAEAELLGNTEALTTLRGETPGPRGQGIDTTIQIIKTTHEGDVVITIGVYPSNIDDGNGDNMFNRMLEGVQHEPKPSEPLLGEETETQNGE